MRVRRRAGARAADGALRKTLAPAAPPAVDPHAFERFAVAKSQARRPTAAGGAPRSLYPAAAAPAAADPYEADEEIGMPVD